MASGPGTSARLTSLAGASRLSLSRSIDQGRFIRAVELKFVRFVIGGKKARSAAPVRDGVAGVDELRAFGSENGQEIAKLVATVCRDQRIDRLRGGRKGFLRRGGSHCRHRGERRKDQCRGAKPNRKRSRLALGFSIALSIFIGHAPYPRREKRERAQRASPARVPCG